MYIPFYELPLYDEKEYQKCESRWSKDAFLELRNEINEIIKEGGSKHRIHELLSAHPKQGSMLHSEGDLRGFEFYFNRDTIETVNPHSFRFLDASYSRFHWGNLKNWTFYGVNFGFADFRGIEFQ